MLQTTLFVITVRDLHPIFFYSSHSNDCQSGMVGVINPNFPHDIDNYRHEASLVTQATAPDVSEGGAIGVGDQSTVTSTRKVTVTSMMGGSTSTGSIAVHTETEVFLTTVMVNTVTTKSVFGSGFGPGMTFATAVSGTGVSSLQGTKTVVVTETAPTSTVVATPTHHDSITLTGSSRSSSGSGSTTTSKTESIPTTTTSATNKESKKSAASSMIMSRMRVASWVVMVVIGILY
jgi:hypothetical protein